MQRIYWLRFQLRNFAWQYSLIASFLMVGLIVSVLATMLIVSNSWLLVVPWFLSLLRDYWPWLLVAEIVLGGSIIAILYYRRLAEDWKEAFLNMEEDRDRLRVIASGWCDYAARLKKQVRNG